MKHKSKKDSTQKHRANTRQGKRAIITYLPPETHTRLKIIAAQKNTTIQALSVHAFELLLRE